MRARRKWHLAARNGLWELYWQERRAWAWQQMKLFITMQHYMRLWSIIGLLRSNFSTAGQFYS